VCACERERERQREIEGERDRGREMSKRAKRRNLKREVVRVFKVSLEMNNQGNPTNIHMNTAILE
jgi:hypothetical protein